MQTKQHAALAFASTSQSHIPFILLDVRAVALAIGRSAQTVWKMVAAGEFPQGILISTNSRRWRSDVVAQWLADFTAKAEAATEQRGELQKRRAQASIEARQQNAAAQKSALARRQRKAQEVDHAPA